MRSPSTTYRLAVHRDRFGEAVGALERGQAALMGADERPSLTAAERWAAKRPEAELDRTGTYVRSPAGVGVMPVHGIVAKGFPSWMGFLVDPSALRRGVQEALADPDTEALALHIYSPGGMTDGLQEFADTLHEAAQQMPIHAHIDDLGASAAYWIAAQASSVSINRGGYAGSIGVYAVVADYSKAAEDEGVEVHVVTTGRYKGAFVAGAPVEDHHLADLQREVDESFGMFLEAVERGRGSRGLRGDALAAVADGRTWMGEDAQARGLVDRVSDFDTVLRGMSEGVEKARAQRRAERARQRARSRRLG